MPMQPNHTAFPAGADTMAGLTMRDYVAIKIMAGFAADPSTGETGINLKLLAKSAYLWADALIEESRK